MALGTAFGPIRAPGEDAVGRLGAAAALAREMLDSGVRGPVLFPCGEIRRDELSARLRAEGVDLTEVVCYRSVLAGELAARNAAQRARVLVVASPSVADLLARACLQRPSAWWSIHHRPAPGLGLSRPPSPGGRRSRSAKSVAIPASRTDA
jgi:uroporphyrinogen-III synthase